jgi:hypothetical protein
MKLWSRGLGRTEIDMDFRYYKVVTDPKTGYPTIIGCMQSPVTWEFTLKMEPDDIAGVVKLILNLDLLKFAFRNLHRYPIYLMNKDQFKFEDEEHLEERVFAVYDKMRGGGKTRGKKRGGAKERAAKRKAAKSKESGVEVKELATSEA